MKEQDIAKAVGLAAAGAAAIAAIGWIFTNASITIPAKQGQGQIMQGALGSFSNPYALPSGAYVSHGILLNMPAGSPAGWYQTPDGEYYWAAAYGGGTSGPFPVGPATIQTTITGIPGPAPIPGP